MQSETVSESQVSLQATREAFEQWRSTRKKRDRIPDDLWEAAVDLSSSYSTCRIAKELRLDYKELKRRIRDRSSQGAPEFVEFNVDQFFSRAQCLIEIRSPVGFEMRVQASLQADVMQLVSLFLKESR